MMSQSTGNVHLPRHIAMIMDGNGRWASQRGKPRTAGHRAGVETARRVVESCVERGVEVLSLFAFSSENWQRPSQEVQVLMELFVTVLGQEMDNLHKNGVGVRFIGEREALGEGLRDQIDSAERLTATNQRLQLVVAMNYGGRWDITSAARSVAQDVQSGQLEPSEVTEELLNSRLSTAGLVEPDLFVRTGGERRLSNFLLWQLAYTELYFTDTLWPEFGVSELDEALTWYAQRQRRFGRTGEQVERPENA